MFTISSIFPDPIHQGWPTGRSPSVSWSIAPDFALNLQDT